MVRHAHQPWFDMLMVREASPTANQGKINFLQLGRFGKFSEQYFRIGFQKKFAITDYSASTGSMTTCRTIDARKKQKSMCDEVFTWFTHF
jgi:hypothetical protein